MDKEKLIAWILYLENLKKKLIMEVLEDD